MSRTEAYDGPGQFHGEPRELPAGLPSGNSVHADYAHTVVQAGNIRNLYLTDRASDSVPRAEVPAAFGQYVNRVADIERLGARIPPLEEQLRMVIITGSPGIGKAQVVRRFAHLYQDRFPGGQLYIDCAENDEVTRGSVLIEFLESLGVGPAFIPPTIGAMTKELRSRTRANGKPFLFVFENAAQTPYVRSALPNSPGSMVLVTAANGDADLGDLATDFGAEFLEVERFQEEHALELLKKFCGPERVDAEKTAATALVRLCLGIPKALVALATALAHNPSLPFGQLVTELSGDIRGPIAAKGETIVSKAHDFQYGRLTAPAQRLYRLLGPPPLPDLSVTAAAVAGDHDPDTARRLLAELGSANLVEEHDSGRYGFHQLAREHSVRLAKNDPQDDHEAALHRLVTWYLVGAAYADVAIMGRERARVADHGDLFAKYDDPFASATARERKAAATAWLESERVCMVPLVRAADSHGWNDETWQLAEALVAYYYNHRHLSDWITVCKLGIRAARRCGNEPAEARLHLSRSRAHTDGGDLDLARGEINAAMNIAERAGQPGLLASAHEFLGRYLEAEGDSDGALAAYHRSRELNDQAKEPRGAALAAFFSARLRAAKPDATPDELEQALRELKESAEVFRRFPNETRMPGRALIAAGAAEDRLGRERDATVTLQEAVRELGDAHYAAEALEKLADIAERTGDLAAARERLRAALRIYQAAGHPRERKVVDRLGALPE